MHGMWEGIHTDGTSKQTHGFQTSQQRMPMHANRVTKSSDVKIISATMLSWFIEKKIMMLQKHIGKTKFVFAKYVGKIYQVSITLEFIIEMYTEERDINVIYVKNLIQINIPMIIVSIIFAISISIKSFVRLIGFTWKDLWFYII